MSKSHGETALILPSSAIFIHQTLEHRGGAILWRMLMTFKLVLALSAFTLCFAQSSSQTPSRAPSHEILKLSFKTMSKALAGCRASYTMAQDGTQTSLVKTVIGAENYEKDMTTLAHAETFFNVMAAHPEKITGKLLVASLSSSDDFYAGVGSTRLAILGNLISGKKMANRPSADELMVASTSLADCQAALFNGGDDFVDLVMDYVGAEDDLVASRTPKRP